MAIRFRRTAKVATSTALLLYLAAYSVARHERWLVHHSGHGGGKTANHSIVRGDVGSSLGVTSQSLAAEASYLFFAPLRWCETAYWDLRYPAGNPWPYSFVGGLLNPIAACSTSTGCRMRMD